MTTSSRSRFTLAIYVAGIFAVLLVWSQIPNMADKPHAGQLQQVGTTEHAESKRNRQPPPPLDKSVIEELPQPWMKIIDDAVDSIWKPVSGIITLHWQEDSDTYKVQLVDGRLYIDESIKKPSPMWRKQRVYNMLSTVWIAQEQGANFANFEMALTGIDCVCKWTHCFASVTCDLHSEAPFLNLPYVQWYDERDGRWDRADARLQDHLTYARQLRWEDRESKAIFRGQLNPMTVIPNLPDDAFSVMMDLSTWPTYGRGKLLALRAMQGNISNHMNVSVSLWQRGLTADMWTKAIPRSSLIFDRPLQLSMKMQAKLFKYAVYVEGSCGWADRLKWMLALGLVPLMQETKCREWYTRMLRPWVHYIPVDGLLNNLTAAIDWAQQNDRAVREMSRAGMEFAANVLSRRGMMYYTERLVHSYIERLHEKHQPKVAPLQPMMPWEP